MRIVFLLCCLVFLRTGYSQTYANWKTTDEKFVRSYDVMQSADTTRWTRLKTFLPLKLPDTNWYSFTLPVGEFYYRIRANMLTGAYYTLIAFNATNGVNLSKVNIKTSWYTDNLTWVSEAEKNVNYYLVEKNAGKLWSQVTKVIAKGNSNYSYSISRGFLSRKPTYRLTPVYISGATGSTITFK